MRSNAAALNGWSPKTRKDKRMEEGEKSETGAQLFCL